MSRFTFYDFETKGLPWSPDTLPEEWTFTSLNPLLKSLNSGFACGRDQQSKSGLIHLRPMNISPAGHVDLSDLRYVPEDAGEQRLAPQDVLFNNTNSIAWVGKTALIENEQNGLAFSNHMTRLRTDRDLIEPAFLVRQLNWLRAAGYFSVNCNKHVNQASISGDFLRNKLPIALPPLPEQRRIVARLEALEARSRRAREKLAAVPTQLAQARRSLLAAAFRGNLTAEWRTLHREPFAWSKSSLGSVLTSMRNGISVKPEEKDGLPILRISAVRPLELDLYDRRFLSSNFPSFEDYLLKEGDLLFTRYNGNAELVGACAVVPRINERVVYPDKLIRVRLDPKITISDFVAAAMSCGISRQHIDECAKTAAGQVGISGKDLKQTPIPLPSLPEQQEIVRRLNAAFTKLEAAATAHGAAVATLDRLDQSLLARAFSGRLVSAS